MSKVYEFEVKGKPQAKQRPRFSRYGKVYTPSQTHNYENWIKLCFINKYPNFKILSGAIDVNIVIFKSIPEKSTSKAKKEEMLNNIIKPTKKPDIDNVVKSVFDALNKIAYKDDSQICSLSVKKVYAEEESVKIQFFEYTKSEE